MTIPALLGALAKTVIDSLISLIKLWPFYVIPALLTRSWLPHKVIINWLSEKMPGHLPKKWLPSVFLIVFSTGLISDASRLTPWAPARIILLFVGFAGELLAGYTWYVVLHGNKSLTQEVRRQGNDQLNSKTSNFYHAQKEKSLPSDE